MAENNLNKPHFQDADKARQYLEALRWPDGPVCPHCGVIGGHYALTGKSTRPGLWKCKDCREQFTVTVGTVFERSKIALHVWLQAVYWVCTSKKGISSHQLHRMLGVTYKTAWFMSHRIREAFKDGGGGLLGGGGKIVEADETFWGNNKPRGGSKVGRGYAHKMKVVALVERDGKARGFHVPDVKASTLRDILKKNVAQNTRLMTDEASMYTLVGREFRSHDVVTIREANTRAAMLIPIRLKATSRYSSADWSARSTTLASSTCIATSTSSTSATTIARCQTKNAPTKRLSRSPGSV